MLPGSAPFPPDGAVPLSFTTDHSGTYVVELTFSEGGKVAEREIRPIIGWAVVYRVVDDEKDEEFPRWGMTRIQPVVIYQGSPAPVGEIDEYLPPGLHLQTKVRPYSSLTARDADLLANNRN